MDGEEVYCVPLGLISFIITKVRETVIEQNITSILDYDPFVLFLPEQDPFPFYH